MACREHPTDQRGDDSVGLLGVDASRRRFLRRAATGAVAVGASGAIIGGLASAAGAQSTGSAPGSAPGSTPGSTPDAAGESTAVTIAPKIEGDDLTIGVFVSSLELATIKLYGLLQTNGKLGPSAAQQARAYSMHHSEHVLKLATFTGGSAPKEPNPTLVDQVTPRIDGAGSQADLAVIAQTLEERLAATYQWAMTQIAEWQFAGLVATILPVDAEQAVAWSQVAVPDLDTWVTTISDTVPAEQTDAGRYAEADYPIAGA